VAYRMSALIESSRSEWEKFGNLKFRFRPEAVVRHIKELCANWGVLESMLFVFVEISGWAHERL
jgi:hypothetical protein